MYGYVYETVNLINGKRYIGQHVSKIFDVKYKGSGKSIKSAIRYWGFDNFKTFILEECNSQKELNEKEVYWINLARNKYSSNMIYNISDGGIGNNGIRRLSEEHKLKISKANKGRKLSSKSKQNMSKADKNFRWMTDGKYTIKVWPKDINYYINKGYYFGRNLSEETKYNIRKLNSINHKGKKLSEEHRLNISKAQKNRFKDPKEREKFSKLRTGIKYNKNKMKGNT